MLELHKALDALEKFRFPGSVPDKYMSLDALDALNNYIESAESEIAKLESALEAAVVRATQDQQLQAAMQNQLGLANIKLGAIALLLQGK